MNPNILYMNIYYSFISIRKNFDLIPNATSASNLQINLTNIT